MSETLTYDPAKDEPEDYKKLIDEYIERMDVLHREIAERQSQTDRLRAETQVVLDRLKAA